LGVIIICSVALAVMDCMMVKNAKIAVMFPRRYKMKRLVVMQPTYLPYIGYFSLIDRSDVFVFLDDVQFSNQSWQQRNRIKTHNGPLVLTVPVVHNGKQQIRDVKIDNTQGWRRKHLLSIENNYKKCKYFNNNYKYIQQVINHKYKYLDRLNRTLIYTICDILDLKFISFCSSNIKTSGNRINRLIDICKHFRCDTYLSTIGSKDYLDMGVFNQNGIKVEFFKSQETKYPQMYNGFIPDLSIIDLLFNMGEHSIDVIRGGT